MKYIKFRDILACFIFLFMAPIALVAKLFIHDFWLVGEERREARDNGYWFFRYVREYYPKQRIAYVIDKTCPDYTKVKDVGRVIPWGGPAHWFWYLTAKKNISSQKGCKPNAAACYLFEVKLRLWRNKRYFLQHGVIINDLEWLYYKKCYFKLFCVSAKPEYDYVSTHFGYPKGIVECTGLARFDNLHGNCEVKRQVLVMPTWREHLVRSDIKASETQLKKSFCTTQYFQCWSAFLSSPKLGAILDKFGYSLLFYPHRNMQKFLDDFKAVDIVAGVKIVDPDELTVQQALMQSACMITDYSSVFFDFAYMKKPVVFYQFDEDEFRKQQYKEGYFDYHHNPLGKWSGELDSCLALLEEQLESGCPQNDHIEEFFEVYDDQNRQRTYEAVLNR